MILPESLRLTLRDHAPSVAPSAWIAPGAILSGQVELAADVGVWFGVVIRGDGDRITVGTASNLQEGVTLHADPGLPVTVGTGVTVGHRAVLHGCTVDDDTLIGMGAILLDGAHIGAGSLVAAGAVITGDTEVPPGSLIAGAPAQVRRPTTDTERKFIQANARDYVRHATEHRAAVEQHERSIRS